MLQAKKLNDVIRDVTQYLLQFDHAITQNAGKTWRRSRDVTAPDVTSLDWPVLRATSAGGGSAGASCERARDDSGSLWRNWKETSLSVHHESFRLRTTLKEFTHEQNYRMLYTIYMFCIRNIIKNSIISLPSDILRWTLMTSLSSSVSSSGCWAT